MCRLAKLAASQINLNLYSTLHTMQSSFVLCLVAAVVSAVVAQNMTIPFNFPLYKQVSSLKLFTGCGIRITYLINFYIPHDETV